MPLEACAFDTRSPSGLRLGKLDGLPDGAIVRTISAGQLRGRHAPARHPACAEGARRAGVERGDGDRALRRQVDDDVPARARRAAGSADLGGGRDRSRAAHRRGGSGGRAAGAEAALRLAGAGADAGPRAPTTCRPPELVGDVYYLQRFVGGDGPDYHDFRVFVIEGEPVAAMLAPFDANWITNVKRGGRPDADAARPRARRACRGRGERGRRGLLRRRHHPRQGRARALRAGGELHAGLVRPADASHRSGSPTFWRSGSAGALRLPTQSARSPDGPVRRT